jgi:hypothetical protein
MGGYLGQIAQKVVCDSTIYLKNSIIVSWHSSRIGAANHAIHEETLMTEDLMEARAK